MFVGLFGASGCITNEITDELSTEIRIDALGATGTVYEVRKRFRFSRSPSEARAIRLERAILAVLAPQGSDLSTLHRLEILVEDPAGGDPVLLAAGEGFAPGERYSRFEIFETGDLRSFVGDDARVTLVFRLESSAWARPLPESGIEVLARTTIGIEL